MENRKHQSVGYSSSSFTETLFGPKDGGSSSSGIFGSVFGPSSTGLGKDSYNTGSSQKQDFASTAAQSIKDCRTQRSKGEKERGTYYQTETAEPSYFSSSIYYGGQEVYPPTTNTTSAQRPFKRGGGDEDSNGSTAARGNWWQGSLYY